MRKIAIILGALLVLIVAAVAALPYLLDVNSYRGRIQSELQARTGRAVSLGNMQLKVMPFAFRVQNAVVGEDPSFRSAQPFAQAQELLVSVKLLPLLRKEVEIDSIELKKPTIELIRNAQGQWNFSTIGKKTAPAQPATQPAPAQPQQSQPTQQTEQQKFELGQLLITDGQVAVTDYQKKQPRAVYDNIDLDLRDYAPGKPVKIDLAAQLPGQGKQELRLSGKGGPLQDDPLATDFEGTLKLDAVSLSGLKSFVNSQALAGMDFVATGETGVKNKSGILTAKGNISLQNPRVRNVNIGYPISADFDVTDDLNRDIVSIAKGALKLGSTPVHVTGTVNMAGTPMGLDLKALVKNASISDAAKLAGAFGVAFNPGMQVNGTVDGDLAIRGTSSAPVMNGTLAAKELVVSGKQLAQPVHVTQVNLILAPSAIRSNEFVASTGSTSVRVAFTLNNYSAANSTIEATVRAPNAQLGELISIGQAYGVEALDGMAGTGAVSIDVRASGPTKNPQAIQYAGSGSLQNASLTVPSFTKPVRVKNANIGFSQNAMTLDNAAFSLGSTNATGQMTIRGLAPGAAPQAEFTLSADQFNVAEWQQMMPQSQPAKTAASFAFVPKAIAQATAQPTLMQRLTGGGLLNVGRIQYGELELTKANAKVMLDRGVIRLSPVTAQLYGGTQTGVIVIDTRPTPSTYTVNTKLANVDANKLLSSMSSLKQTLFGVLMANADTRFTGSTSGNSADTARSLNGRLSLNLQNGKLAGIDMLNTLASIGKFLNLTKQAEPFTNIAKLTGDFDVRNGVARTENLLAAIDGGTLGAKGEVDLASQTINMVATAVLSQQMAQQAGGTGIGGYLTTALANNKGELVMPVLITGSLTSPKVAPDYQTIAKMKLQNVLPTGGNASSITGILGAITGGRKQDDQNLPQNDQGQNPSQQGGQPQGQGPQQHKSANPVQGILDALGGKKPQQQPPPAQQPPQQPQQQPPPQEDTLPDPSKPK